MLSINLFHNQEFLDLGSLKIAFQCVLSKYNQTEEKTPSNSHLFIIIRNDLK